MALRSTLLEKKQDDFDGGEPLFDASTWRMLRLPLTECLRDLRSQLVREACGLASLVAESLNSADGHPKTYASKDGGRALFREVVPTLFELLSSGNKLSAQLVDDCLRVIIARCRFRHLVSTVAEYSTKKTKSAHARECCALYAKDMATKWGESYFGRHDGLPTLEKIITTLLEDPNSSVREEARNAYKAFATVWPPRGDALLSNLDRRVAKLLEQQQQGQKKINAARI